MTFEETIRKIKDRRLSLTVVGAGYVGLPTAALFANAGFSVNVSDLRPEIVDMINNGSNFVKEPGLQRIVSTNVKMGRLRARLNNIDYSSANAILICVQTPMNGNKEPNLHYLLDCIKNIGSKIQFGTIVVVCSTIPSGTMRKEIKPILENSSGLKADNDFYLVFVPERIAPGNALTEFAEGTRLVGGIGQNSTKIGAELFRTVCKNVLETDATVAEVAKLAENTFRDVNIAFANELALLCEKIDTDVISVIKVANTHPRVNIHSPGPGVGGPCLTKDPYYLLDGIEKSRSGIIAKSRIINDKMSEHVVRLVKTALVTIGKEVSQSKISVLGVTYKKDVDDSRNSPSEPIIRSLVNACLEVVVFDPWCPDISFGAKKAKSLYEAITGSDCVVVVTDHSEFSNIDLQRTKSLMKDKPVIVDGRRIIDPVGAQRNGFIYYGIGRGEKA
jgi:UDP-N-acetyl-D-mannosaminuronic acid dehydrogenase